MVTRAWGHTIVATNRCGSDRRWAQVCMFFSGNFLRVPGATCCGYLSQSHARSLREACPNRLIGVFRLDFPCAADSGGSVPDGYSGGGVAQVGRAADWCTQHVPNALSTARSELRWGSPAFHCVDMWPSSQERADRGESVRNRGASTV